LFLNPRAGLVFIGFEGNRRLQLTRCMHRVHLTVAKGRAAAQSASAPKRIL
jgi:hypothetical protein